MRSWPSIASGKKIRPSHITGLQDAIDEIESGEAAAGNSQVGIYNPLDYGAVGDGVTDDTAAFLAMNVAAEAANGMIHLPPLQFGISDEIEFYARNVVGGGSQSRRYDGANASGTEFLALHADACIKITSSYGSVSGITFDGNDIATRGIVFGQSSGGFFSNLTAVNCVGNGVEIVETQNCVISGLHPAENGGHGIAILGGVGEVQFHQIQSNHNNKCQLFITAEDDLPGGNTQAHVHFIGGLTEHCQIYDQGTATGGSASTLVDSTATWAVNDLKDAWVTMDPEGGDQEGRRILSNTATTITVDEDWTLTPTNEDYLIAFPSVSVGAGTNIGFYQTAHTNAHGETPTVDVWADGVGEESEVVLTDVKLIGDVDTTIGIAVTGTNSQVFNRNVSIVGAKEGIRLTGVSGFIKGELPRMLTVTTPVALNDSASFTQQLGAFNYGMKRYDMMYDAAHPVQWIQIDDVGETAPRYQQLATGEMQWAHAAAEFMTVNLKPGGANLLQTDDSFMLPGTYLLPLRLGDYRLWVNPGDGKLYIKSSAPANATDGTVVGTQS